MSDDPNITGSEGDTCSKGGMDMKNVQQASSEEFHVELSTSPHPIEAGKPGLLTLVITTKGRQMVPLEVFLQLL